MLLLTRDSSVLLEDALPDYFVKGEDYLLLSRDKSAREILLDHLGKDRIIIDWVGEEKEQDKTFERKENLLSLPKLEASREVGYYHRL